VSNGRLDLGGVVVYAQAAIGAAARELHLPTVRTEAVRLGEIAEHVSAFKPFYVGRVSLYVLGLLVLFGLPVAVLAAIRGALRQDPLP